MSRRRSFLICFTGVDGSGKTTHAKAFTNHLKQKGYRCKYVWGAYRPLLAYAFFALTRVLGYWKKTRENAYTNPLEFASENVAEKLAKLYLFLLFFDLQIRTTAKIRLSLILGKAVICDRYFYDLLMELKRSNILSNRFMLAVSKTLPKPLMTFLLDTHESLTQQRRGFSVEELAMKRRIYLEMAKIFGFIVIDSSQEFSSNQERIRTLALACIT